MRKQGEKENGSLHDVFFGPEAISIPREATGCEGPPFIDKDIFFFLQGSGQWRQEDQD